MPDNSLQEYTDAVCERVLFEDEIGRDVERCAAYCRRIRAGETLNDREQNELYKLHQRARDHILRQKLEAKRKRDA